MGLIGAVLVAIIVGLIFGWPAGVVVLLLVLLVLAAH